MDNTDQARLLVEQLKSHFGLHSNPFAQPSSVFYEGAQRMHNIETLRHLSIFGDMVLLLTGEKGAGKTTLIERFSLLFSDEINIMAVAAGSDSSTAKSVLRLALLSRLQLIEDEPVRQTLARLIQKHELDYQQHGKRTLFLIDDADLLPKEELRLYFSVFREQSAESGVVVLLAGLPSLVEYAVSGSNIGREEWIHQVQLKPFSSSETLEYLQLRLQSAGYVEPLLLNKNQSRYLNEMGKGLPGRINRIFGSVVMEVGSYQKEESKSANVSFRALLSIVFLLLLSFVFVSYQHGLFEFGQNTSKKPETVSVAPDQLQERLMAENDRRIRLLGRALKESEQSERIDVTTVDTQNEVELSIDSGHAFSEENVPEDAFSVEKDADQSVHDMASVEGNLAQDEPLVEEAFDSDFSQPDIGYQQPVSMSLEVEKDNVLPTQKISSVFRSKEWLIEQPASDYTAQVLGSYHEKTAIDFVENSGQAKKDLFYLRTVYKGKIWYVVLYGQFSSKSEAVVALDKAPKIIKKEKPWLRSFQGILKTYPK